MNIRFLAQSEYFNGIHLKDDIILEKEYEESPFKNINKVRYFIYHLEDNVRKEVLPRNEKLEVYNVCDCTFRSDYIYFTEYDDQYDGTYVFNIIKYNFVDDTWNKIITLKDDMSYYPYNKQIKFFVLDDSNIIIQRAVKRRNLQDNYEGFFDYSTILFNYVENKQTPIVDENLVLNGIDYILPFTDNTCVMKTGFSLLEDGRHDLLSKEESSVESLILINVQQFVSDLLLQQQNMVMQTIDQAFYDDTIANARIIDNYLIYSKYNFDESEEKVIFLNLSTRESLECINKTVGNENSVSKTFIIDGVPHIRLDKEKKTEFFNLETKEIAVSFNNEVKVVYVNNNMIVTTEKKKGLLGGYKDYVYIHKYPSSEIVLQEKGKYIGAVASDDETTFIFLK